jgi:hypothetical protein
MASQVMGPMRQHESGEMYSRLLMKGNFFRGLSFGDATSETPEWWQLTSKLETALSMVGLSGVLTEPEPTAESVAKFWNPGRFATSFAVPSAGDDAVLAASVPSIQNACSTLCTAHARGPNCPNPNRR